MIFRSEDYAQEIRNAVRGGDGSVTFHTIMSGENLPPHAKMVAELHFEKGCSIGPHIHEGEYEIFYVAKGTATITDGEEDFVVKQGSTHCVYPDGRHGVRNNEDEELVLFATIITV